MVCGRYSGRGTLLKQTSFRDLSVYPDGQIDSASDPDQEHIYFMGSETVPSACYILSDESSI